MPQNRDVLVNVPIEPIPYRYSCQWDTWFKTFFISQWVNKLNNTLLTICPAPLNNEIHHGRFLDSIGTNYYKSAQLQSIMQNIYDGKIPKNSIFFFHDLWFPGIEQIAYTSDLLGLNFRITGCLHAGAYDPNDFLYQNNLGRWAVHFEHALLSLADCVFVATEYHKQLILKSRSCDPNKIKVTGFPIYFDEINKIQHKEKIKKENIIIFPNRLDPEKNPEIFIELQHKFSKDKKFASWKWLKTVEEYTTKENYYKLLLKAKIAISFSDQETWGIAMQECLAAGCMIFVPDKLSYVEMYDDELRYSSIYNLENKLKKFISKKDLKFSLDRSKESLEMITIQGTEAINNIFYWLNRIYKETTY